MSGRHDHVLRVSVLAADTAAAAAATFGAYFLRFHVLDVVIPVRGRIDVVPGRYLAALPVAILLLLFATGAAGLYEARRVRRPPGIADAGRLAALAAAALASVTLLYWNEFQYSRLTVVLAAVLHGVTTLPLRRAALRVSSHVIDAQCVAIIGGGAPARAYLAVTSRGPGPAPRVAGVLAVGEPVLPEGARSFADLDSLCAAIDGGTIREVVVAVPAAQATEVPSLLARLEQTTADVRLVPDIGPALLVNAGATVVGGLPVLALRERPLYGVRAATKRALDVTLAAVLLVLLAPILLVIALLVRATSPGAALFRQERMGMDGRPFGMLKFRTMREGAEAATGPVFARRDDPRATPIGRVLRRFSLDELPQLWNVLLGDMSLVGPRPERAPFIEEFRRRLPGYMLRHTVKAGMTGWAQVHGLRGETSFEDRLRYDLEYVDRWSLSLDLEILGRTAVQVLVGRNAY